MSPSSRGRLSGIPWQTTWQIQPSIIAMKMLHIATNVQGLNHMRTEADRWETKHDFARDGVLDLKMLEHQKFAQHELD